MSINRKKNKKIGLIPVRAGSKGLPGKNFKSMLGIPLFMHAVQQALRHFDNVIVCTDYGNINDMELPDGCIVLMRPPALAEDDTPIDQVISFVIEQLSLSQQDIVLLQATSPLRSDQIIKEAIELFETNKFDLVMSVVERDPKVLKYGTISDAFFHALKGNELCFVNRQALPKVFGPNGAVYVFSANTFQKFNTFPNRNIGVVYMPSEHSLDVDSLDDFERAESLLGIYSGKNKN